MCHTQYSSRVSTTFAQLRRCELVESVETIGLASENQFENVPMECHWRRDDLSTSTMISTTFTDNNNGLTLPAMQTFNNSTERSISMLSSASKTSSSDDSMAMQPTPEQPNLTLYIVVACAALLLCAVVTGVVVWRQRRRATDIDDNIVDIPSIKHDTEYASVDVHQLSNYGQSSFSNLK